MIGCIGVISLALLWLLYEADWMRLRMLVGPVVTSCPWSAPRDGVELRREDFGIYRWQKAPEVEDCLFTKSTKFACYQIDKRAYFSPGVVEPICGWEWIEGRVHPKGDNTIYIIAWGCRSTATFTDNDPKRMKDYCAAALKPTTEQRKGITKQRNAVKRANKLTPVYA